MSEDGRRAVFLDRDGVITRTVLRNGRPCSPRTMEEFAWEDGVQKELMRFKDNGLILIVVTNQPDIARYKMSMDTLNAMTDRIYSEIPVNAVLVCPHDDIDGCNCRKPKPGMLFEAAKVWGIDCTCSFMIGDGWKDMGAGQAAGCTTIILDRPYNQEVQCDYRVPRLKEAVEIILREVRSEAPVQYAVLSLK